MNEENEQIDLYQEIVDNTFVDDEDLTFGDVAFLLSLLFIGCVVVCFIFKQIKSTFKHVNLKVGKIELGVETKNTEDKKDNDK